MQILDPQNSTAVKPGLEPTVPLVRRMRQVNGFSRATARLAAAQLVRLARSRSLSARQIDGVELFFAAAPRIWGLRHIAGSGELRTLRWRVARPDKHVSPSRDANPARRRCDAPYIDAPQPLGARWNRLGLPRLNLSEHCAQSRFLWATGVPV